jgi:large subunit ribosomal protein L35
VPKIKTRKGIAKRIRVTSTGKLMRAHAWKSHLLEHKKQKNKQAYRQLQAVHKTDRKQVRRALGI